MGFGDKIWQAVKSADLLGVLPGDGPGTTNRITNEHGSVVGFGRQGHSARDNFRDRQRGLLNSAGNAGVHAESANDALAHANSVSRGITDQGRQLAFGGRDMVNSAATLSGQVGQGALMDAQARANGLTDFGASAVQASIGAGGMGSLGIGRAGAHGVSGIMGAAARPASSLAEAQFQSAQLQGQQNAASLAATMGRGGNAALAGRQAQQALAGQSSQDAAQFAALRAQEEAGIRNSQIAAATSAGQLGVNSANLSSQALLSGTGQAGQVGNQAFSAAGQLAAGGFNTAGQMAGQIGQLGQGQTDAGGKLLLGGTGLQADSAQKQGDLALGVRGQSLDQFRDLGIAQSNADQGFGTQSMQREAADQAAGAGIAGSVMGLFS